MSCSRMESSIFRCIWQSCFENRKIAIKTCTKPQKIAIKTCTNWLKIAMKT